MKKLLFLLASLLCVSFCSAEVIELGDYTQTAYGGANAVRYATEDGSIYIEVTGDASLTFFYIENNKLNNFRTVLADIRDKFAEWENIAKTNNVKDMRKPFPQSFVVDVAWYTSKWWFSYKNMITPNFNVNEEGKCRMTAYVNAVSWNNEYIKNSCILILTSVDDFNSLLNVISDENINSKLNTQDNKANLFQ